MTKAFFLICLILPLLIFSCSLDYGNQNNKQTNIVPEMILSGAKFTRIEKLSETAFLEATVLEIFKEEDVVYGKDVSFKAFEKNGSTISFGNTDFIKIDNRNSIFILLGNTNITDTKNGISINSNNFKWNSKTNQLVSDKDSIVTVSKVPQNSGESSFFASGTGFVLSGLSMQFAFNGKINGIIESKN
ncbi:MAG: hypothetical protein GX297_02245 [Treponema sp.]|nr:hypothetical protein [Treponema sp.]